MDVCIMNDNNYQNMLNVMAFGAKGDGVTDDTASITEALNKAAEKKDGVFFPAGVYMCADIKVPKNVGLYGVCNWGYRQSGGSCLKLNNEKATCLLNITDALGVTINGLYIDGNNRIGNNV